MLSAAIFVWRFKGLILVQCSNCRTFNFIYGVQLRMTLLSYITHMGLPNFRRSSRDSTASGHFHNKLEVQKMQFLGLISSQNKIYCSILHLHSKHMVVFYIR